jgi:hypothetical protein
MEGDALLAESQLRKGMRPVPLVFFLFYEIWEGYIHSGGEMFHRKLAISLIILSMFLHLLETRKLLLSILECQTCCVRVCILWGNAFWFSMGSYFVWGFCVSIDVLGVLDGVLRHGRCYFPLYFVFAEISPCFCLNADGTPTLFHFFVIAGFRAACLVFHVLACAKSNKFYSTLFFLPRLRKSNPFSIANPKSIRFSFSWIGSYFDSECEKHWGPKVLTCLTVVSPVLCSCMKWSFPILLCTESCTNLTCLK